jgi:hypothetical protein
MKKVITIREGDIIITDEKQYEFIIKDSEEEKKALMWGLNR